MTAVISLMETLAAREGEVLAGANVRHSSGEQSLSTFAVNQKGELVNTETNESRNEDAAYRAREQKEASKNTDSMLEELGIKVEKPSQERARSDRYKEKQTQKGEAKTIDFTKKLEETQRTLEAAKEQAVQIGRDMQMMQAENYWRDRVKDHGSYHKNNIKNIVNNGPQGRGAQPQKSSGMVLTP